MEAPELISINSSLNRKAKFFGFLPISQVMPIGVIAFLCFLIVGASGGKDKHFGIMFGFMTGTWLLATGTHPHYMTDRMRPLPGKNWGIQQTSLCLPHTRTSPRRIASQRGLVGFQQRATGEGAIGYAGARSAIAHQGRGTNFNT